MDSPNATKKIVAVFAILVVVAILFAVVQMTSKGGESPRGNNTTGEVVLSLSLLVPEYELFLENIPVNVSSGENFSNQSIDIHTKDIIFLQNGAFVVPITLKDPEGRVIVASFRNIEQEGASETINYMSYDYVFLTDSGAYVSTVNKEEVFLAESLPEGTEINIENPEEALALLRSMPSDNPSREYRAVSVGVSEDGKTVASRQYVNGLNITYSFTQYTDTDPFLAYSTIFVNTEGSFGR